PEAKESARASLSAALAAGGYGGRGLGFRGNAIDTPRGPAGLSAAAAVPLRAGLLPKVGIPGRGSPSVSLLALFAAPQRLAIWCLREPPLGVLKAREIAGAGPRLAALVVGTSDLTADLRAVPTRDRLPLLTSLGITVLAARAHGLAVLDGVHLDLSDDDGF